MGRRAWLGISDNSETEESRLLPLRPRNAMMDKLVQRVGTGEAYSFEAMCKRVEAAVTKSKAKAPA